MHFLIIGSAKSLSDLRIANLFSRISIFTGVPRSFGYGNDNDCELARFVELQHEYDHKGQVRD